MRTSSVTSRVVRPRPSTDPAARRLGTIVYGDLHRSVVRTLELEGNERVLQIGLGGGSDVRRLLRRLPWGFVAGIDVSEVALRRARRRNRISARMGLADLRLGDASHLPWPDDRFDAALSVNAMAWEPLPHSVWEVRRVLKPESAVTIATYEWASAGADDIASALWGAGFAAVRVRRGRTLSGPALYVTGCVP